MKADAPTGPRRRADSAGSAGPASAAARGKPDVGGPNVRGPDVSRRVPAWATGIVLAIAAGGLLLTAVLAGMVGPLEAHPPDLTMGSPPPRDGPTIQPQAPAPRGDRSQFNLGTGWLWWVLGILAGVVCVAIVMWVIRAWRRPRRMVGVTSGRRTAVLSPASLGWLADEADVDIGAERTIDVRLAADDIIASWAAVEETAEELDHARPQASTPTEFLAALTDRFGNPDVAATDRHPHGSNQAASDGTVPGGSEVPDSSERSAARTLLRLYHRARFDTATLRPGAATAARSAAHTLLTTWLASQATQHDSGPGQDGQADAVSGTSGAASDRVVPRASVARRRGEPR